MKTVMSIYIHVGKNIGTGMNVFIAICKGPALPRNFTSLSTLTGSHEITRTKLIANSLRVAFAHIFKRKNFFIFFF